MFAHKDFEVKPIALGICQSLKEYVSKVKFGNTFPKGTPPPPKTLIVIQMFLEI